MSSQASRRARCGTRRSTRAGTPALAAARVTREGLAFNVRTMRLPDTPRIIWQGGPGADAAEMFDRLDKLDPWDAALAAEPEPRRLLTGEDLDGALEVAADFIDLKSPFTAGHSREVAALTALACERAGLQLPEVHRARRAGLVHDLGRTAVPNSIWDKPAPLARAERDRVQLHPVLTEQMLRRAGALAGLNPVAASHHEKPDGLGYAKGPTSGQLSPAARILGAADRYQAMTQHRAHRPALSPRAAAAELRQIGSHRGGGRRRRRVRARGGRTRYPPPVSGPARRSYRSRGRSAHAGGITADHSPDRGAAGHLPENRRQPHPAHLRQDRMFYARHRSALRSETPSPGRPARMAGASPQSRWGRTMAPRPAAPRIRGHHRRSRLCHS